LRENLCRGACQLVEALLAIKATNKQNNRRVLREPIRIPQRRLHCDRKAVRIDHRGNCDGPRSRGHRHERSRDGGDPARDANVTRGPVFRNSPRLIRYAAVFD
jgi:hypothetical protein